MRSQSKRKPTRAAVAGKPSTKSRARRSAGRRAVPKQRLAPPAGDPIYAAISRCIETEREAFRVQDIADANPDDDREQLEAAAAAVRAARMALAKTPATTSSGLATLTRFLKDESEKLDLSFFDDEMGEALPFFASLDQCVTALLESDSAEVFRRRRPLAKEFAGDPVFAAIERWRRVAEACDRKSGDLPDKLADREGAALRTVAKCVPTTPTGILALLDFALDKRKVPYSKKPVPLMERGLYDGDLLETVRRACHSLFAGRSLPAKNGILADPIFAALKRYNEAERVVDRLQDIEDGGEIVEQELRASSKATLQLRMELAKTVPTTLAGLAALARFLKEQCERFDGDHFFQEGQEEIPVFYVSLDQCACALLKASAMGPGEGPALDTGVGSRAKPEREAGPALIRRRPL